MDEIDEIKAEIKEIHDNNKRLLHNVNVSSFFIGNFLGDQAEFLDSICLKAKAKLEKLYETKDQLEKAKILGDDIDELNFKPFSL
jgi:formylglycine-generating enzyme required for sulfatase activity